MDTLDVILLIIGLFLAYNTFAYIFFEDHRLYPISEGVILGGSRAYILFSSYRSLMSSTITPIMLGRWILVIPLLLGMAVFSRFTRYRWVARYPLTLLAGVGVGVLFGLTLKAQLISNVVSTIQAILTLKPDPASSALIFIGFLTSMTYFLYSAGVAGPVQPGRRLSFVLRIGRIFLYAGLGYLYVRSGGSGSAPSTWLGLYLKEPIERFRTILAGG